MAPLNRQRKLFRARRKSKGHEVRLRPATKVCGRCENLLGHSVVEEGRRKRLPATQCQHKGRGYLLNGFLYMTLCVCCLRRMKKRTPTMTVKEEA
jgi:hypothetical protein